MEQNSFSIIDCCNFTQLPSHDYLFSLLDQVTTILENEPEEYRQRDDEKNPGGLIQINNQLTSIIVPDLHARPYFLENILNFKVPSRYLPEKQKCSVLEAMENQLLNIICVGDAFHTEKTIDRWDKIQAEFDKGCYTGEAMQDEMLECLSCFCAVLNLKLLFPKNFHFIKGNHENVLNVSHNGDRAFAKYADEGDMVKKFISNYYGEDILYLISVYENLLPMMVKLPKAVVSHAEPSLCLTKEQLVNVKSNPHHIYSLIWTKNGEVKENTCDFIINSLFEDEKPAVKKGVLYFGGHRPVKNKYETRQNGRFVQIHNPVGQNVVFASSKKKINLEKDILNVNYNSKDEI